MSVSSGKLLCLALVSLAVPNGTALILRSANPALIEEPVEIMCIGDSVTSGAYGMSDHAYPIQLESMLKNITGKAYHQTNLGAGSATMLRLNSACSTNAKDNGLYSYWNSDQWKEAQSSHPDIVTIMLGVNDGLVQKTCDAKGWEMEFEDTYVSMVKQIQGLSTKSGKHPVVYLITPSPVKNLCADKNCLPGQLQEEHVNGRFMPILQRIATKTGAKAIDIYSELKDFHSTTPSEVFLDGVHPKMPAFHTVIAETVASTISAHFQKGGPHSCGDGHCGESHCDDGHCGDER